MSTDEKPVGVAVLGLGNVGSEVVRIIEESADDLAARVGALAHSGEVLVSGTVKDLVAGSGIEFGDRGEHELKGVPGVWRLFTLAR